MEFLNFHPMKSEIVELSNKSVLPVSSLDKTGTSSIWESKMLITVLVIFILTTIAANTLIFLAVCSIKMLRSPRYYLIVSLALSDLLAAFMMFPALSFGDWHFGRNVCNAWIFFDQMIRTASILNLCMISIDRYWLIVQSDEYSAKRTPLRMICYVSIAWIGAIFVSLPPLLFGKNVHLIESNQLICSVSPGIGYQIYATVVTFYVPYGVVLFVYLKIFRARRMVRETLRRSTINGLAPTNISMHNPLPHQKKLRFKLARTFKASNIIGLLVAAFTICWLPFFALAAVRPFFDQTDIPKEITFILLWVGYVDSLLNPVLIATLLHEFRQPIQRLLCCRWSKLNAGMRKSAVSQHDSKDFVVKIDWL